MLVIGGVLLAVSLCANVLLGRSLLVAFERLQLARIFPLGYLPDEQPGRSGTIPDADAGSRSSAAAPAARESIAFWGDSRAYMWDTRTLAHARSIENFAHGAQTSAQVLLQLQTTPPTRATYSIVQVGINDLHSLGVLKSSTQPIVRGLRGNIIAIRDALLARSERVVLTTVFPPGPVPLERKLTWDPQTLALIDAANRLIREAADGRRVVVLDANTLLRGGNGLLAPQYADPDFFLHVNQAAYDRLNSELLALLGVASPPYSK